MRVCLDMIPFGVNCSCRKISKYAINLTEGGFHRSVFTHVRGVKID